MSGCEPEIVGPWAPAALAPVEDPLVWCGKTATWLIGNLVLAVSLGLGSAKARWTAGRVGSWGSKAPSH